MILNLKTFLDEENPDTVYLFNPDDIGDDISDVQSKNNIQSPSASNDDMEHLLSKSLKKSTNVNAVETKESTPTNKKPYQDKPPFELKPLQSQETELGEPLHLINQLKKIKK